MTRGLWRRASYARSPFPLSLSRKTPHGRYTKLGSLVVHSSSCVRLPSLPLPFFPLSSFSIRHSSRLLTSSGSGGRLCTLPRTHRATWSGPILSRPFDVFPPVPDAHPRSSLSVVIMSTCCILSEEARRDASDQSLQVAPRSVPQLREGPARANVGSLSGIR